MNSLATLESITIKLCLRDFPNEIIEIITKYLLIPSLKVVDSKSFCVCGEEQNKLTTVFSCILPFLSGSELARPVPFFLREIRLILSKYHKEDVVSYYDSDKVGFITYFCICYLLKFEFKLHLNYDSVLFQQELNETIKNSQELFELMR